jgi:glucokinase
VNNSDTYAIGIDLGATKIAAALVSRQGEVLASRQVLTEARQGTEAVLDRIAAHVNELSGLVSARQLMGVGIGTPGQVDPTTGVVRNAVNLGWDEVELAAEVRLRLSRLLPIWVQKDANAGALGEYIFGAGRGCPDFVYLGIGSGLGGGVVANGRLVSGVNQNAAEIGHLSLDPQGLLCNCGNRGCAETVISGPGLHALTEQFLVTRRYPSRLEAWKDLRTSQIVEAAKEGDALAQAAIGEVGRCLGIVMAACVALLNPARLVLGGGLGLAAFDLFLPEAIRELQLRTLAASYVSLEIIPSTLVSPSIGAASLAWYYNLETERR